MDRRKRKCLNCKEFFTPHPSTHHHQRFCSTQKCQRARKASNNRRFRQANPDYDKGRHNVNRIRAWRKNNPRYWRNEKRNGGSGRDLSSTLQAVHKAQPIGHQVVTLQEKVNALQAVSDRQDILFQGLAAQLTGFALQAELAPVLDAWYDKGQQLSGLVHKLE